MIAAIFFFDMYSTYKTASTIHDSHRNFFNIYSAHKTVCTIHDSHRILFPHTFCPPEFLANTICVARPVFKYMTTTVIALAYILSTMSHIPKKSLFLNTRPVQLLNFEYMVNIREIYYIILQNRDCVTYKPIYTYISGGHFW